MLYSDDSGGCRGDWINESVKPLLVHEVPNMILTLTLWFHHDIPATLPFDSPN